MLLLPHPHSSHTHKKKQKKLINGIISVMQKDRWSVKGQIVLNLLFGRWHICQTTDYLSFDR